MSEVKNYEQQEHMILCESNKFVQYLVDRGLIKDPGITDETTRQSSQKRKYSLYHNTLLLLKNYRNICWQLKSFPTSITAELDRPLEEVDNILSLVDDQLDMGNRRLESRLRSLQKSRILIDRLNEAVAILKTKPGDGPLLYDVIYTAYLQPEELGYAEIIERLNMSIRQYYRLRKRAVNLISIRLWSAPSRELEILLDTVALLEAMNEA